MNDMKMYEREMEWHKREGEGGGLDKKSIGWMKFEK